MLAYRYRRLAVKVTVAMILIAVIAVGLLYSGVVSNVLPQDVHFGD